MTIRRRLRAVRLAFFAVFTLLPVVWGLLHLSVPWWGWLAAGVLASYTGALRMIVQRGWVSDTDCYRARRLPGVQLAIAALAALPLALVWPCVWIAMLETGEARRATRRMVEAEHLAAEAKALRKREKALGL